MKWLIKNPLTIWCVRLIKSKILEYKNKDKNLKIGYMASAVNCSFGLYNTVMDRTSLVEVKLGDFTYIGSDTRISKSSIGKFCSIGHGSKIGLGKHPSANFVSTHPIFFSPSSQVQISFSDKNYFKEFDKIIIGNDVWIGVNAIVLDGVNIGDGVIVAAGAVVTKDIPPYAIVGGVPAKIIRFRFETNEIEKLLELKWWNMDTGYLKNNFTKFHDIKVFLND